MTTLKIEEMISKYDLILITSGANKGKIAARNTYAIKKDNVSSYIKDHKTEIVAELQARKDAGDKAEADRKAKIDAIEGLAEIKNAIAEHEEYHYKFSKMMDDEYNDGANPPHCPLSDVTALRAKYPRADAYIKAESYSCSSQFAKSDVGKKALVRIINGEDFESALADMESEWSAYCSQHIQD
jgi:general stress protein 26